jgi:hypothetical protein
MNPLILDDYRSLFRDDASFDRFVQAVSARLEHDLSPVISKERVLGAILSPEATKEVLYERMIRRISDAPEILDQIRDRIENDEIVD